ncbi:MAG TPA: hypothetical protein GX699_05845 [Firmicutes bacterium]|nr:hypothetical protein [Bacillota bacterium]
MDWIEKSKYYLTWEKYLAMNPDIDERNQTAMKSRFEEYQDKMFNLIMSFLF